MSSFKSNENIHKEKKVKTRNVLLNFIRFFTTDFARWYKRNSMIQFQR